MDLASSKERYYHNQNLPSPKPFSVLEPQNRPRDAMSPSKPKGRTSGALAEIERLKAGEVRSKYSLNEVGERDRLIDFLKAELTLLQQNYRRLAEEFDVAKVQDVSQKHRIKTLERQLQAQKAIVMKLEFDLKVQFLNRDSQNAQQLITDYEDKMSRLHTQLQSALQSKDKQIAALKEHAKKILESTLLQSNEFKAGVSVERLNHELSALESEKRCLIERIKQMDDDYEMRLFQLQSENGDLRVKIAEVTSQMDNMHIVHMNQNFQKSLNAQDTHIRIETLQEQLNVAERRIKELQSNLPEYSAINQYSQKNTENQLAEQYVVNLSIMRNELLERINETERRYEQLEQTYRKQKMSKTQLINQMSEMSNSVESSQMVGSSISRLQAITVDMTVGQQISIKEEIRVSTEQNLRLNEELHQVKQKLNQENLLLQNKVQFLSTQNEKISYLEKRIAYLQQEREVLLEEFRLRQLEWKKYVAGQSTQKSREQTHNKCQEKIAELCDQLNNIRSETTKTISEYKENFQSVQRLLTETSQRLQSETQKYVSGEKTLRSNLHSVECDIARKNEQIDRLSTLIADLQNKYQTSEAEKERLLQRRQKLHNQQSVEEEETKNRHLLDITALQEQAAKDKARICDLQQLAEGKEQKIAELAQRLEMHQEEAILNINRAKEQHTRKARELQKQLDSNQVEISNLMSRLANNESTSGQTVNQIKKDYETRLSRILEENRQKEVELTEQLSNKEAAVNNLRVEINDKNDLLTKVKINLTECENQLELLDEQHQKLKSERSKLKQMLTVKENEVGRLRLTVEENEQRLRTSFCEIDESKSAQKSKQQHWIRERERLNQEIQQLSMQLTELKASREIAEVKITELTMENKKLHSIVVVTNQEKQLAINEKNQMLRVHSQRIKQLDITQQDSLKRFRQLNLQVEKKLEEERRQNSQLRSLHVKETAERSTTIVNLTEKLDEQTRQQEILNEKFSTLRMEMDRNQTELSRFKDLFSKQEEHLSQTANELTKVQTQLKLAQNRHLELMAQAEEQKKELQRQLNKVALQQSSLEAEIKQSEAAKYSKQIEELRVEHCQILEAEERAHSQQLELKQRQFDDIRQALLTELEKIKDCYRRSQAEHLASSAITRQTTNDQIKKHIDIITALELELNRMRKQYAALKGHFQAENRRYIKLKNKYEFIKRGFMAVQEELENQDTPSPYTLNSRIQMSDSPNVCSADSLVDSHEQEYYLTSQEMFITQTQLQGTIMTELSSSGNYVQYNREVSIEMPEAIRLEMNLVEVECSKTLDEVAIVERNEYVYGEQSAYESPNKRKKSKGDAA